MRIVSLNVWGGAVFDELVDWLPTTGADALCLQEVTCTPGMFGWATFADGERTLPQRANLFDDVRGLLPQHQGMFATSDAGPVHDDAGRRHVQGFGLGTFVHERVMVIGGRAAYVHRTFTEHDDWPRDDRPRIAQALRLIEPGATRAVTLVQVHGVRDRHGKIDTPARRAQAERLAALVESVREPGDLTVVCGDFNVLPDSETFGVLGEIGLVDLVQDTDTRTSRYPKQVRHASYLLVSEPAAVEHFEIVTEPEVSDHRPLLVKLSS